MASANVPLVFNFTLNKVGGLDVFIEVYQYEKNQQQGLELLNLNFPSEHILSLLQSRIVMGNKTFQRKPIKDCWY